MALSCSVGLMPLCIFDSRYRQIDGVGIPTGNSSPVDEPTATPNKSASVATIISSWIEFIISGARGVYSQWQ